MCVGRVRRIWEAQRAGLATFDYDRVVCGRDLKRYMTTALEEGYELSLETLGGLPPGILVLVLLDALGRMTRGI